MARGGFRAGAGRPKGAPAPKERKEAVAPDIKAAAKKAGLSPLDYMLAVMNNQEAETSRRDRMAIAAAPFCHARREPAAESKKDKRAQEAEEAMGDTWAPPSPPRLVVDNK